MATIKKTIRSQYALQATATPDLKAEQSERPNETEKNVAVETMSALAHWSSRQYQLFQQHHLQQPHDHHISLHQPCDQQASEQDGDKRKSLVRPFQSMYTLPTTKLSTANPLSVIPANGSTNCNDSTASITRNTPHRYEEIHDANAGNLVFSTFHL